jgi:hypothetical protein
VKTEEKERMMTKLTLPSVNLDLTLEAGKMKAITAAASGKGTEYIVRVDQLRTIPGFNVRVTETDDYRTGLESLKQSIRENGFYPNKPLGGYIGKDGDEDVIYVTDGHRRLQAVNEINDEDVDGKDGIEGLPVVLKAADSTIADLTIALVQDNSGQPLTPYEMGVVVQRLANMKGEDDKPLFTKADIARKLSITERYIDDLNILVAAPAKVRTAVLEGTVVFDARDPGASPRSEEGRRAADGRPSPRPRHRWQDQGDAQARRLGQDADGQGSTVSMATGDSIKDVLKAMAGERPRGRSATMTGTC